MAHDGWLYQGRQKHQWFGHGTKPHDHDRPPHSFDECIRTLARTVVAFLPARLRNHLASTFDAAAPERLSLRTDIIFINPNSGRVEGIWDWKVGGATLGLRRSRLLSERVSRVSGTARLPAYPIPVRELQIDIITRTVPWSFAIVESVLSSKYQMIAAIARNSRVDWSYIIENRVLCRVLEGVCLRGVMVGLTGRPGQYKLLAYTQTWFGLGLGLHFGQSFEFTHEWFNDHTLVAGQFSSFLEHDAELRRVILAGVDDAVFISSRVLGRPDERLPDTLWFDSILIRAWEHRHDGLLPELREFRASFDQSRPDEPEWNRYRQAAASLERCLEDGQSPRSVIEPWNQAVRDTLRIAPVARMRPGAVALQQTLRAAAAPAGRPGSTRPPG